MNKEEHLRQLLDSRVYRADLPSEAEATTEFLI